MDVLVIAFGILAAIWILVLLGARFFGPRDPKSTTDFTARQKGRH